MILSEDKLAPPPPYLASAPPLRRSRRGEGPSLSDLPPNLVLQIVDATFPQYFPGEGFEAYRRNLYWLTISLRLVSRGLHIACMHTLRSAYVDTYLSLVKPPYTSDPFPMDLTEASGSTQSPASLLIQSHQRETEVLDLFIALKTREDVWLDETHLHLEREESFNDLFSLMQPRRRMEDLLRHYGLRYGFITLSDSLPPRASSIPFSRLGISFSTRKVGVVLITPASKSGSRRTPYKRATIIERVRDKDERLEVSAKRLARDLGRWITDRQ